MANLPTVNFSFGAYRGTIQNIAVLRSTTTSSQLNKGDTVQVTASVAADDHGGGDYVWIPTSILADDNLTVICPNDTPPSSPGRWILFGQAEALILEEGLQTVSATVNDPTLGNVALHASYEEEITLRASGDSALSQRIDTLTATVSDDVSTLNASITNVQSALTSTQQAQAQTIQTLTATVTSNNANTEAEIQNEQTARADGDSANADAIQNLTTTVTTNASNATAAIQNEQQARADGDSANATAISNLTSTVTSNAATASSAITNEQQARAAGDAAQAQASANLEADYNAKISATQANVTSEATARANADSALSQQIQQVSAGTGGNANLVTDVSSWGMYQGATASVGNIWGLAVELTPQFTGEYVIAQSPRISVSGNATYTLSCDLIAYASKNGGYTEADCFFEDSNGTILSYSNRTGAAQSDFADGPPRYSTTFTTPPSAVSAYMRCLANQNNVGDLQVVGIRRPKFEHGSVATTFTSDAQILSVATAASNANSAVASLSNTVTANYNSLSSSVSTNSNAIAGVQGRTSAYWQVTSSAGGNVANVTVEADGYGAGVNITGNVNIDGNVVINGSLSTSKLANNSVSATGVATQGSAIYGNNNAEQVASYNLVTTSPSTLFASATGHQGYSNGARAWNASIQVSGIGNITYADGSAGFTDSVALSGAYQNLPAGSYTVTFYWSGTDSTQQFTSGTLYCQAIYK